MKNLIFFLLIFVCNFAIAQQITLDNCYNLAKINFAIDSRINLNTKSSDLEIKNLQSTYYPTLNLVGTASYQTPVLEINLPIPNVSMPEVPNDQYKTYFELQQIIYSGGAIKSQKKVEEISLQSENKSVEVEFQTIKQQINDVYFLILLFEKQQEIIDVLMKNLDTRLTTVKSAVENGILMQVNYDIILAEKLKAEQQIIELQTGKSSALKIISELTDTTFTENTDFEFPEIEINFADTIINRPEIQLLKIQQIQLNSYSELLNSQRRPKIIGFAQAGYGRPGLNMLSSDFNPYFIAGITATWNIWDWNSTNRDKQILKVSSEILEIKTENFEKTINIELQNQISTIEKLEKQILKDDEIIDLRNKIITAYSVQLENGTISSSEYIIELNAVTEAKLNKELHKIQLLQAKTDYLTVKGN